MATHSSLLASRIPWTEEPGGYSPRGCKESDVIEQLGTHACHSLSHSAPLSTHPSSSSWMILGILQVSAQRSSPPLVYLCPELCPRCHGCYKKLLCRQLLIRHAFPRCAHPVWAGPVSDAHVFQQNPVHSTNATLSHVSKPFGS